MRVALDARTLNREHVRGIGRCLKELVTRSSEKHGVQWDLLGDRPDLPFHLPKARGQTIDLFEFRGYRFHSWEQLGVPHRAAKRGADLLHAPANRVPWWQPVPTVTTVHDTIPWQQEEPGWHRGWYLHQLLPRAFRKCAAIITISESSKRDILRRWPDLAPKLHVIPNGVGDDYLDATPQPLYERLLGHGIRTPYLLYFGGSIPRKRLDWALRVAEALSVSGVQLVLCGVEPECHEKVRAEVSPQLRERICFAPFIAEEDLPNLYQNAVAVLYPTLYEGFGLPALEAQAVGAPVLFSDVSSLGELKGPGAVVLPPYDLDQWVASCRALLARRSVFPTPNDESRIWARRFSWDQYTERTVEVYRAVAFHGR